MKMDIYLEVCLHALFRDDYTFVGSSSHGLNNILQRAEEPILPETFQSLYGVAERLAEGVSGVVE